MRASLALRLNQDCHIINFNIQLRITTKTNQQKEKVTPEFFVRTGYNKSFQKHEKHTLGLFSAQTCSCAEIRLSSPAAVRLCVLWVNLHRLMTIFIFTLSFIRAWLVSDRWGREECCWQGGKPADRSDTKGQKMDFIGLHQNQDFTPSLDFNMKIFTESYSLICVKLSFCTSEHEDSCVTFLSCRYLKKNRI